MVSEELLGKKQPTKKLSVPQLFKEMRNSFLSLVISEMRVLEAVRGLSDTLVQNVGKSPRDCLAFKHCSRFGLGFFGLFFWGLVLVFFQRKAPT